MAFPEILSAQTEVGRLFSPELGVSMFERDWALFDRPVDFFMNPRTTPLTVQFDITVMAPKSWALDPAFAVTGRLELELWFQLKSDLVGPTAQLRFTENPLVSVAQPTLNFEWVRIVRFWEDPLPTDEVVATVELDAGTVQRTLGEGSPDSGFRFFFR